MTPTGQAILEHLHIVETQRALRAADPALARRVHALKGYQQARFANTYADLLNNDRYAGATRFFLEELYGPHDFAHRDRQFARIVPALVRLFPDEIVATVAALGALHALSETLDTQMAQHLESLPIDAAAYIGAWQRTDRMADRERQIELTVSVGRALERYTRNPVLRHSLRVMRGPAAAAGLAALQSFLEAGFERFRAMRGANEFLSTVAARERALVQRLLDADAVALATTVSRERQGPLGQLP
jgi:hypothetical protein